MCWIIWIFYMLHMHVICKWLKFSWYSDLFSNFLGQVNFEKICMVNNYLASELIKFEVIMIWIYFNVSKRLLLTLVIWKFINHFIASKWNAPFLVNWNENSWQSNCDKWPSTIRGKLLAFMFLIETHVVVLANRE